MMMGKRRRGCIFFEKKNKIEGLSEKYMPV
jgi:hypothetical protein